MIDCRWSRRRGLAMALCAAWAASAAMAQPPAPPRQEQQPPRAAAPLDLTGQWVSIVNEDWRWRMVTPPKGDYASVPLNAAGRAVADAWEASADGACEAYGAAGLLRRPTRLRIRWDDEDTLRLETDAGMQTRLLEFAPTELPTGRTLQGRSAAHWVMASRRAGGRGLVGTVDDDGGRGGYLQVETTLMLPGWLRRNGVPYSEDAVLTEYFDRFTAPNGDEWLMVTTIVDDPTYLTTPFITSSHFRREDDASNWNPTRCGVR